MSKLYELGQSVLSLSHAVDRLCENVESFGFRSPKNEPWYELLKFKALRQLSKRPYLVVAVMGGTNTGKSVIFNHLAGEIASAADHRAAGTKHPVCLVPADATQRMSVDSRISNAAGASPDSYEEETPEELLRRHFETFEVLPWTRPEDPLEESGEHRLFWRLGQNVPSRLLLVDTPDIDSDAQINWDRARTVRQTADLIIAVLTEQKYADAAVKKFFREANEASKPVILLFNMVDTEHDLAEVPLWSEQFTRETGVQPSEILLAPHDRSAVDSMNLRFQYAPGTKTAGEAVNLSQLLSQLHFETIKSQTLLGALRIICDPREGTLGYLDAIREESRKWGDARKTLENAEGIEITWPGLPTAVLAEEIRGWWEIGRPDWTKKIHNTYRSVGNALILPLRKMWTSFSQKKNADPMEEFRKQESQTVTMIVEKTIGQLEKMAETDNPVLREALQELLTGESRQKLLEQAKAAHQTLVPINDDFRQFLREALQKWSEENPGAMKVVRSLDLAAAIARPAVTITLVATGFVFVGSFVGHIVLETALTGGITGTGEVLVNQTGEGVKRSFAKLFQSVQEEYARNRARHFFGWFQREIWGNLIARLEQGEELPESPLFLEAETAVKHVLKHYEAAK